LRFLISSSGTKPPEEAAVTVQGGPHRLGLDLLNRGQVEAALPHLRAAWALEPHSAEVCLDLGVALARSGTPAEAEAFFRRALELRPGWPEALGNLGLACLQQDRLGEAEDCLQRAVARKPESVKLQGDLALVLRLRAQANAPRHEAGQAGSLSPRQPPPGLVTRLKPCRHGLMAYQPNDAYIGRSLDLYGEYSEGEVRFLSALLGPGQTALDVGANIGALAVPLARAVGPRGRVLAFEPQRIAFYTLCANAVLNGLPQLLCLQHLLGQEPGTVAVPELDYRVEQNFGSLDLGRAWEGQTQPVARVRIDDLALAACHLIKVDVEGMEREVLEGARQTIARCRPYLYVEDDRPDRSQALRECLLALGYRLWLHTPPYFSPDNYLGNPDNVFIRDGQPLVSINLFGCPAECPAPAGVESSGLEAMSVPGPLGGAGR
jgi:FkbM family methyltransferase